MKPEPEFHCVDGEPLLSLMIIFKNHLARDISTQVNKSNAPCLKTSRAIEQEGRQMIIYKSQENTNLATTRLIDVDVFPVRRKRTQNKFGLVTPKQPLGSCFSDC
jgi:hypothetical protein